MVAKGSEKGRGWEESLHKEGVSGKRIIRRREGEEIEKGERAYHLFFSSVSPSSSCQFLFLFLSDSLILAHEMGTTLYLSFNSIVE